MGHLFWQPTPVPLNSPVPSQTLGQVWADPYYNNEVFSSSIMPTPFLLRWNIGWLGLFPPDSHLATPLHLTVMSHPRELLLLLYWAEKVFYLTTCISARRCGSDRFLEGGEKGWIGGKYKFQVEISFPPGLAGTWEGTALGLGPVGKWPACNLWQKRGCFDWYL